MQKLTLQQVIANVKQKYAASPAHIRSHLYYAKKFYAQGYYMKTDGYYYSEHGGREYRKYSTAS